ncbi:hypothetical protein [Mycoplasma hafezii]|uniref:hypothetical protein n=1 Tax=Mycoplasma hafezii TaxID=525886 RepID=UPI003CED6E63
MFQLYNENIKQAPLEWWENEEKRNKITQDDLSLFFEYFINKECWKNYLLKMLEKILWVFTIVAFTYFIVIAKIDDHNLYLYNYHLTETERTIYFILCMFVYTISPVIWVIFCVVFSYLLRFDKTGKLLYEPGQGKQVWFFETLLFYLNFPTEQNKKFVVARLSLFGLRFFKFTHKLLTINGNQILKYLSKDTIEELPKLNLQRFSDVKSDFVSFNQKQYLKLPWLIFAATSLLIWIFPFILFSIDYKIYLIVFTMLFLHIFAIVFAWYFWLSNNPLTFKKWFNVQKEQIRVLVKQYLNLNNVNLSFDAEQKIKFKYSVKILFQTIASLFIWLLFIFVILIFSLIIKSLASHDYVSSFLNYQILIFDNLYLWLLLLFINCFTLVILIYIFMKKINKFVYSWEKISSSKDLTKYLKTFCNNTNNFNTKNNLNDSINYYVKRIKRNLMVKYNLGMFSNLLCTIFTILSIWYYVLYSKKINEVEISFIISAVIFSCFTLIFKYCLRYSTLQKKMKDIIIDNSIEYKFLILHNNILKTKRWKANESLYLEFKLSRHNKSATKIMKSILDEFEAMKLDFASYEINEQYDRIVKQISRRISLIYLYQWTTIYWFLQSVILIILSNFISLSEVNQTYLLEHQKLVIALILLGCLFIPFTLWNGINIRLFEVKFNFLSQFIPITKLMIWNNYKYSNDQDLIATTQWTQYLLNWFYIIKLRNKALAMK